MKNTIQWIKDGFAHHLSSDKRWMIERKEFDLPYKCVRWDLYDGHRKLDRCDTLKEAKALAESELKEEQSIFVAYASSGIHFGHCFLGASHAHAEAKRMAGRKGYVMEFESLEEALERFPEWEENILCDI